jgi:hypothetical protein
MRKHSAVLAAVALLVTTSIASDSPSVYRAGRAFSHLRV